MAIKVDDLAASVAALQPEEVEEFERTLSGLRAERARAEEARLAGLKEKTDEEVVTAALDAGVGYIQWNYTDTDLVLKVLRDAGFVREATMEAAYREGYERGAYDFGASTESVRDVEDDEYVMYRGMDLAKLTRKA
ncbi:hypothetical protein [Methylobacterium sp. D48H]